MKFETTPLDSDKIVNSEVLQTLNGLLTDSVVVDNDWVLNVPQNWDSFFFVRDENAQVSVGETGQSGY
jgi:hypothetical protein